MKHENYSDTMKKNTVSWGKRAAKHCATLSCVMLLSACGNTIDRLENVGKAPELTKVENPKILSKSPDLSWPLPAAQPQEPQQANSLWQPGSRTFFRDLRATRVGDIVKVNIEINDKAEVDNTTNRTRSNTENAGVPQLFGLESIIAGKLLPGAANVSDLLTVNGSTNSNGSGSVDREEIITTQVAAVITQKLPNGNLVIQGSQEIRVNYEVREVSVAGVIRPQDISSENAVDQTQIAEARISYGGRGQISDVQQPRAGYQIIDILSPF